MIISIYNNNKKLIPNKIKNDIKLFLISRSIYLKDINKFLKYRYVFLDNKFFF